MVTPHDYLANYGYIFLIEIFLFSILSRIYTSLFLGVSGFASHNLRVEKRSPSIQGTFYTERRRFPRVEPEEDVTATLNSSTINTPMRVRNISCGGALLQTCLILEAGETVDLDIRLPFFVQPISVRVRVVWTRMMHELTQVTSERSAGVEFLEMSRGDRQKLHESLNILTM
jgi:hypothetical protein